jgi:hypothetical protein
MVYFSLKLENKKWRPFPTAIPKIINGLILTETDKNSILSLL